MQIMNTYYKENISCSEENWQIWLAEQPHAVQLILEEHGIVIGTVLVSAPEKIEYIVTGFHPSNSLRLAQVAGSGSITIDLRLTNFVGYREFQLYSMSDTFIGGDFDGDTVAVDFSVRDRKSAGNKLQQLLGRLNSCRKQR